MKESVWKLLSRRWRFTLTAGVITQVALWLLPLDRFWFEIYWANGKKANTYYWFHDYWIADRTVGAFILVFVLMATWNIYGIVAFIRGKQKESRRH